MASQQGATSEQLSSTSAWLSVIVMSVLVLIALRPLTTLWNLLILKFEILIQLSPAFILGAQSPTSTRAPIGKQPIVCGLLAGLATALGLFFTGYRQIGNFHAGVIGLAVNYALVFALDGIRRRSVA